MDGKNSTIYDVAKVAGVSISTVSRVLNAPQRVSEITRKKVLNAIQLLQFIPKAEASARARKQFGRIGVLTPSLTMPSFVERLRGIAYALHGTDYELIVYSVGNTAQFQHYIDMLSVSQRVDGLIIMTLPIDEDALKRLMANNIEIVCIEIANPLCCNITVNNTLGGLLAAEHLMNRGYRRCAYIGEDFKIAPDTDNSFNRFEGFRQGLFEHGIEIPDTYIHLLPLQWTMAFEMDMIIEDACQLLDLPEPPEAVFAYSDLYAIGVLKAARSRNIRIPEELAVVGFDDIDTAKFMELTTVNQHLEESGKLAIEVLLSRMLGNVRVVQNIELQVQIQERSTT